MKESGGKEEDSIEGGTVGAHISDSGGNRAPGESWDSGIF